MNSVRKQFIWFLILGPGLFVATIAGNELYGYLLVQHELQLCRAAGMELDAEKFNGPPIPDAENAAPLYLKALAEIRQASSHKPPDVQKAQHVVRLYFKSPEYVEAARRLLAHYENAFLALDSASCKQVCRFSAAESEQVTFDELRELQELLSDQTRFLFRTQGAGAAYRNAERNAKIIHDLLLAHPCLPVHAMEDMWEQEARDLQILLQDGAVPPATCAMSLLRQLPTPQEVADCVRKSAEDEVRTLPRWFHWQRAAWFRWTRPFDRESEAFGIRSMRLCYEHAAGLFSQVHSWPWPPETACHVDVEYDLQGQWYLGPARWAHQGWYLLRQSAQFQADVGMMRIALLLELYRSEHGNYPGTLDGLVMPDGTPLPLDPFDGNPFRYVRKEKGYELSSYAFELFRSCGFETSRMGPEWDNRPWLKGMLFVKP